MEQKKITGFDYLWCALYACAAFAIELLLVAIEKQMGMDVTNYTIVQNIIHWIITTTLWIIAGIVVIAIANRTTGFDIWEHRESMKGWQIAAILICFAVNIVAKYWDWNGFKVIHEFESRGPLLFVFQYIYYIAEGFLISLVIVYGQIAFEKWFKNTKIPYGGIVLGLTWGLMHTVSKGNIVAGIMSALAGFLFGTAYLFLNKDYRKTLPVIILLFVL